MSKACASLGVKGSEKRGMWGRLGSPSEGEARARVSLPLCATVTAVSGLGRRKDFKKMAECLLYSSRGR